MTRFPCASVLQLGFTTSDGAICGAAHVAKCAAKDAGSTSALLGFRLSGCGAWQPRASGRWTRWSMLPEQCRQVTTRAALTEALRCWAGCKPRVVLAAAQHVRRLRCAVDQIRTMRLYSASVLLLYDAAEGGDCTCEVALVDFAHAFQAPQAPLGRDENVIGALDILEQLLSQLGRDWASQDVH